MSGDDTANLIYLLIWGLALGGYLLATSRGRMGETLRHAALWGLIFTGAIAVAALWPTIREELVPRAAFEAGVDEITLPRARDGHFYLTLEINETPVEFLVDTGATDMVLNLRDARRVGLNPDDLAFLGRAFTANGEVRIASVTLDTVRLGDLEDSRFRASVNEGDLDTSLLGMSYLERFSRIAIEDGRLNLRR